MAATRILGIDPGTRVAGWGLVEAEGSRLRFLEAGVLRASASAPVAARLATLSAQLRAVVARGRPDTAAMESVFVKLDPQAALAVGEGRGALLAVLGEAGLEVAGYPPATVKRAVAGNGRAAKDQVARMVAAILRLPGVPEPLDATDALAVAVTHALRGRAPLPRPARAGRRADLPDPPGSGTPRM